MVQGHFRALVEASEAPDDPGSSLPRFVQQAFAAYLACGAPSGGFTRLRCPSCSFERRLAFSCGRRSLCPSCAARRMQHTAKFLVDRVLPDVPLRQWVCAPPFELVGVLEARSALLSGLRRIFMDVVFRWLRARAHRLGIEGGKPGAVSHIQRFSGALILYPHHHALVLDGVYTRADPDAPPRFHALPPPSEHDMRTVAAAVAHRFARYLERSGLLTEDDEENPKPPSPLDRWYERVLYERAGFATVDEGGQVQAPGPAGRRRTSTGEASGFSIDAFTAAPRGDQAARERLCRYIARPPFADAQLSATRDGRVALRLEKPRPGRTHVVLEPLRLLRRLAWLIPTPHKNLITYRGVLAPAARWRADIVPARLQLAARSPALEPIEDSTPLESSARAITWAHLIRHRTGVAKPPKLETSANTRARARASNIRRTAWR